jgi:hypothetical protein
MGKLTYNNNLKFLRHCPFERRNICSPQASVPSTLWSGGGGGKAHTLAGEGLGESQLRRGDIHCGALYI